MHRSISILDSNSCMDDDRSLPTSLLIVFLFCPLIVCGCECVHLSLSLPLAAPPAPVVQWYNHSLVECGVHGTFSRSNYRPVVLNRGFLEQTRKKSVYVSHVCIVECRQRIWSRTDAPLHAGRPSLWSKSLNPTHRIAHIGIAERNNKLGVEIIRRREPRALIHQY